MSRARQHIAQVGCGRWGKNVLRDLKTLGCRVTVADRSPDGRARARAGGADQIVGSIGEIPRGVDGIVVVVRSADHASALRQVLPLRVPVFVEKPLTLDSRQAFELAEAAAGRLFVMEKWRYHPGIQEMAGIVRRQEFGPVHLLRTMRLGGRVPYDDCDGIWILAPHDLSIIDEILGGLPRITSCYAEVAYGQPLGLLAVFGDRPRAVMEVSENRPCKLRQIVLCCRDASVNLPDPLSDHLQVLRPGEEPAQAEVEHRSISNEFPLLRELRAFVEHLKGGPPPKTAAARSAALVKVIEDLRLEAGVARLSPR